jgi:hypothetical protein
MTIELLLTIIGILGLGTVIGAYFQSNFQHSKELKMDNHKFKRNRYGSILIQMLTLLDPKHLDKVSKIRPDLMNIEDLREELKKELLNAVLYANDDVIKSLSTFNKNPNYESYLNTVSSMRKDLWGKNTRISSKDLDFVTDPHASKDVNLNTLKTL